MKRIIWSRFFRSLFAPARSVGTSRRRCETRAVEKRSPRALVRPRLESLEDRTLLSSYVVNVGGDALNPNGSPVTGTLRWAVTQADLNPNSTITFDTNTLFGKGGSGTITLSHGELPIKVNMTIQGASAANVVTISGGGSSGASRVFDITAITATVAINNLTITNGNAEPSNTTVAGNQGGDIFNGGNLTLNGDIITNGTSTGNVGGPIGRGGAIYNAEGTGGIGATLVLNDTIVENSVASGAPGFVGGQAEGGAIFNDTNATLILGSGTQIIGNQAIGGPGVDGGSGFGGGVFNNTEGNLQIIGNSSSPVFFQDNVAEGFAGATGANGFSPTAKAKHGLPGSSGSGGGAGGSALGGGVYSTGSILTLQYANFLGNQAIGGRGGDGGNGGNGGSGTSVTGGTGGNGGSAGSGGSAQGGGIFNGIGTLTVSNVVFGVDKSGKQGNQALGGSGGVGAPGGVGGKGKTVGGTGGIGGAAGSGGFAEGGAVYNAGSNVSFTNTTFTSSLAQGGNGNNGAIAGNAGSATGTAGTGGAAGNDAGFSVGGAGGNAEGGAIANQNGNLSINGDTFAGNQALGGNGGVGGSGGVGGTGGAGSSKITGGVGGVGGGGAHGGVGGNAQGGGFYNVIGTVTIENSTFKANSSGTGNQAVGGNGGDGGNGGNGGQGGDNGSTKGVPFGGDGGAAGVGGNAGGAGFAEGGAGGNQGGDTFISTSTFTSSLVQSGTGGSGGSGGTGGAGGNANQGLHPYTNSPGGAGGNAGNAGNSVQAFGGALAISAGNVTITGSTFGAKGAGNQVIGGAGGNGGTGGTIGTAGHVLNFYYLNFDTGNGGQGGTGASVNGGALSLTNNTQTVKITGSTFSSNAVTGGNGGAGGAGGVFGADGALNGINGPGGEAGQAQGGAILLSTPISPDATLNNDMFSSNSATGGMGGAGAINDGEGGAHPIAGAYLGIPPGTAAGLNGFGSNAGAGGSVMGAGLADVNYNLSINSSTFSGNSGTGGVGGTGGGANGTEPYTFVGGAGGAAGNILGGGVFVSNSTPSSLLINFNGSSITNNNITGGTGGLGGNAGASGHSNITGGIGGQAGYAQGGGIYLLAGSSAINNVSLANTTLSGNVVTGGTGGAGGSGYNATGGDGGIAQGGAVFNTSLNTASGQNSTLNITASTVVGNQANGGVGGNAGSGTTPNGGMGGAGGNAGNADGAGLYNGDNTPLTVINSTFGGGTTSKTNSSVNYNVLVGGRGGTGGNAGTPSGVVSNNGGPGGNGGSIAGGNIFNASKDATITNDTIVFGQAVTVGVGGVGGSGAGTGGKGKPGPAGSNGTGVAGGYFAAASSSNTLGNTILALNNAASDPDAAGNFTSAGNNLLSDTTGATGFNTSASGTDQIVTQAQLNLGPLLNNGGPTATDALLDNVNGKSVAIDAGNNALITTTYATLFGPNPTDQRGIGFPRIDVDSFTSTVDVGAYEYQAPAISNLNPPSGVEQGSPFTLTITGTGFIPGAIVSWDFNGSLSSYSNLTLTPSSISTNQITVTVPANALPDEGTDNVTVTVPDGSGMAGETLTSAPAVFTITEGAALTLTVNAPTGSFKDNTFTNNESDAVAPITITSSDPDTTYSATGLPPGLSINPTTGVITGTIDSRGAGAYAVTINGIDDGVIRGTTTFNWTVNDTTPPAFTNPGTQKNNEGDSVLLATKPVDADAGSITATGLPKGLSIDSTTGIISGTIDPYAVTNGGSSQNFTVKVSATDGTGNVGSTTFTWTVADTTPPNLTNPGNQTSDESDNVTLPIQAGDADSYSATGLPTGLSIDSTTGIISGTVDPHAVSNGQASQNFAVTVTATDNGFSSNISFTWTVNDTTAPTLTSPGNQTNNEGDTVSLAPIAAVDADPGSFTVAGLPSGLSINANTGVISGTIDSYVVTNSQPSQDFTVTVSATDNGHSGSTTFTWTVNDTTPPELIQPADQNNNEGDSVNLAIQISDLDGVDSYSATGLPTGLSIDAASGIISGTIGSRAEGTYSVTVTATDDGHSSTTTFNWNVADTTPPAFTNPGTQFSSEGASVTVATNPVDADKGSITATGLPKGLSIDSTTGVISGTVGAYAEGNYTVTVSATDGTIPNSIQFDWKVADTTPPGFTVGTQNSNEGASVTVATNPVDADKGSISASGLPTGLVIDPTTGVITGTIGSRATGTYTVTLNATDGKIAGSTTFTWNVADSTPPTLTNPGSQNTNETIPVSLAIQAVDADTFSATGLPAGLSINPTTGVISGTVFASAGTYQVTVSASDDRAVSQVTFPWVINPVDPVAIAVSNIQNTYVGLYQVETVTAQVTNLAGIPVDRGAVTFHVNGETMSAPVINGFATVTFATPMLSLDMTILTNDLFTHTLDAVFGDSTGVFGPGESTVGEAGMFLDFLLYLQSVQFSSLAAQLDQLQLPKQ